MRNKYNLWYQLKIISIMLISVVFLSLLYVSLNHEMLDYKSKIVDNWTKWQKNMVNSAVNDALSYGSEDFENYVVEKIVPSLHFNEASYAVFYGDNKVIFEDNSELTKKYSGKTIRDAYGSYSYSGGYHLIEVLLPMEKGKSGTDYFVKNHFKGKEYITWNAFKYSGKTYILGSVTSEKYILSLYDFEGRKNNLYAFSYVYSFLIILFATLLSFASYRYNKTVQEFKEKINTTTNLVAKQKNIINDLETRFESLSIYDLLTGLYNRKFFDVFFPKIESDVFIPVSIAIIDIDGLKLINNALGYQKGDEVIISVANICVECCDENDVVSRYGTDEFAIIMINTTNSEAIERLSEISNKISANLFDNILVEISYGIATKTTNDENIYDVVEQAEKNLHIDKLTAKNSIHSGSVNMLRKILQEKTTETEEHCERIEKYAAKLATVIGMNEKKIRELVLLAYLHDVGKIAIPDAILNKKGSLTDEEYEIMKSHPTIGYNIAMASPDLKVIAKYILQHHEKWNGSGYPKGIAGEKITIEARIISIVDSFDAMISARVYKGETSIFDALAEIESCAGEQFDPDLAKTFVEIVRKEISSERV